MCHPVVSVLACVKMLPYDSVLDCVCFGQFCDFGRLQGEGVSKMREQI